MKGFRADITLPKGWHELSQKQLRFVFELLAAGDSPDEVMAIAFTAWSRIRVLQPYAEGILLVNAKGREGVVEADALMGCIQSLAWLKEFPDKPLPIQRVGRACAVDALLVGVPFSTYIMCDNFYQGYLISQDNEALQSMALLLYEREQTFDPATLVSVFYWWTSLKLFLAKQFPTLFQAPAAGEAALPSASQLKRAMDAQLRALTKGDVTKEQQVLATDTWRALTELEQLAVEYYEFKRKSK